MLPSRGWPLYRQSMTYFGIQGATRGIPDMKMPY